MVYRYSWIAGIGAIALAMWELTFLMRDSTIGTPWPVAILVATLLGAGITWTAIAYRAHAAVVVVVNLAAFVITAGLLIAPDTLWVVFPTAETWEAVRVEFGRAMEIIRFGVEPVRPVPGLVMMLAGLFWILGFLLVAGLLNGRPFVAILTPLIVALQFVIIDRRPKSIAHLAVFVGVVALCLLAIRIDERDSGAGKLQRVGATTKPTKRPSPAIGFLVLSTVAVSLFIVGFAGNQVPNSGLVEWRQPAGFTDEYSGSATYNPYTDIRARVNNQTDNPLFQAEVFTRDDFDPASVRFRVLTLDVYQHGRWATDRVKAFPLDDEPWLDPNAEYLGPTATVSSAVTIQNLTLTWLPAPITPLAAIAADERDEDGFRVRRLDGSLYFAGDVTFSGLQYVVLSEVPRYDANTLAALARAGDSGLSPLFEAAIAGGEDFDAAGPLPERRELEDEEFWLEYPEEELGPQFTAIAKEVVGRTESNFEKGLLLENYFRNSGEFTYNSQVPPENATDDVLAWLTDEENPFSRHGYCEQFATAMALMARAAGVPSRVVLGFTAGTALNSGVDAEDGSRTALVQVQDRNAHSWVELWIPEYGWMQFDPTPRSQYSAQTVTESFEDAFGFSPAAYADEIPLASLVDQGDETDIGPDSSRFDPDLDRDRIFNPGEGGTESSDGGLDIPLWAPWTLGAALLILIAILAAPVTQWWRRRRLRKRLAAGDVSAAWEDIVDRLSDLKEPINPASTPLEAAHRIDPAFVPLASTYGQSLYGNGVDQAVLTKDAEAAHERAQQHLTTRYSRGERIAATYRPTRISRRYRRLRNRLRKRS